MLSEKGVQAPSRKTGTTIVGLVFQLHRVAIWTKAHKKKSGEPVNSAVGEVIRFGNMAGVFQVMAFGVRVLDKKDLDPSFKAKLAKIATAEMISSKEKGRITSPLLDQNKKQKLVVICLSLMCCIHP
ncbi:uncharacterized protein LOC21405224 isoform X1 [Morus notabilis]|uniref:uncharacterized protein LOC21405224 isoform X1 n=2 Tax=Morus notabilis TaxID=981085 RepID=UPI000CED3BA7|nr:uncharacterized protein LOC21405224 isoform X1 [Morus notabilis]XP_024019297.1 uncharacterized protein LOC21405224 isoform X1 [Morus notabilis]